jgi:hypothetical protein
LPMQHACVINGDGEVLGQTIFGTKHTCPDGCTAPPPGANGNDCSISSSCYY